MKQNTISTNDLTVTYVHYFVGLKSDNKLQRDAALQYVKLETITQQICESVTEHDVTLIANTGQ